jgi:hypothetical protein
MKAYRVVPMPTERTDSVSRSLSSQTARQSVRLAVRFGTRAETEAAVERLGQPDGSRPADHQSGLDHALVGGPDQVGREGLHPA